MPLAADPDAIWPDYVRTPPFLLSPTGMFHVGTPCLTPSLPRPPLPKLPPVSGGLPHCFPQFGPGVIQQHGFGRNLEWEVVGSTDDSVSLKLSDNEETMAMWPHPFECVYKVTGCLFYIFVYRR